jgi:hypothetical protein
VAVVSTPDKIEAAERYAALEKTLRDKIAAAEQAAGHELDKARRVLTSHTFTDCDNAIAQLLAAIERLGKERDEKDKVLEHRRCENCQHWWLEVRMVDGTKPCRMGIQEPPTSWPHPDFGCVRFAQRPTEIEEGTDG